MSMDAMKQALEALEYIENNYMSLPAPAIKAIAALRLAIEQAERQEPGLEPSDMPDGENPMYDHPFFIEGMVWANNKLLEKNAAQRQRQPLTDEEIEAAWKVAMFEDNGRHALLDNQPFVHFARAIERAHGIGGVE